MEYWNDYELEISKPEKFNHELYELQISLKKHQNIFVYFDSFLNINTNILSFSIDSCEYLAKSCGVPTAKHLVSPHYLMYGDTELKEGYEKTNRKKAKSTLCISLGVHNVRKLVNLSISEWRKAGYTVDFIEIERETGAGIKNKNGITRKRVYKVK